MCCQITSDLRLATEDGPRLPQTPDNNVRNNRKLSTATIQAAIIKCTVDLADLGTVGVTRKYTVCQNVNICEFMVRAQRYRLRLTAWGNRFLIQAQKLDTLNQILEIIDSQYPWTAPPPLPPHPTHHPTRPQFRSYIWRRHWHGLNVFSTKTRRSMSPADGHRPSLLIREKFRSVTRKTPLESQPRDNLKGFHGFRQSLTQISRQYQTSGSNCLLPYSAHRNTSCLGLSRLQLIHEPWQFKGPVVTHLESSGRSEQYHPGNYP